MNSKISPERDIKRGEIVTTDATVTTLKTLVVPRDGTIRVSIDITARRYAGASGTAGDSATYNIQAAYKNIGGTVSLVEAVEKVAGEDQAGWDADLSISGETVLVQVTGASGNTIRWVGTCDVQFIK